MQAIRHFDDWQRSTLNEMARAFMGQGNYRVVDRFRREDDMEQAGVATAGVSFLLTDGRTPCSGGVQ